jgi:MFS family permease
VLRLLRNRDFVLLWLGQDGSSFGTWLLHFALVLAVYDRTRSASLTAAVFLAQTAPLAVLGGWAGGLADRFERRTLLVLGDLASATLTLPLLLPGVATSTPAVCALLAAKACVGTVFLPAYRAFLPAVVRAEQLPSANALMFLSGGAVSIAGPLVGAVLYAAYGLKVLVLVDLTSFLLSVLTLLALRTRSRGGAGQQTRPGLLPRRTGALWQVPILLPVIAMSAGGIMADGVLSPTFAPYLQGTLGSDARGVGLAVTVLTLGTFAGSALGGLLVPRWGTHRSLVAALAVATALLLGYALAPGLGVALATLAVMGIVAPIGHIAQQTMFQTEVPDAIRGEAFGSYFQVGGMLRLAAGLGVALTADAVGVRLLLVTTAVLSTLSLVAFAPRVWRAAPAPAPEPLSAPA